MARDLANAWDWRICSWGSRAVPQGILTGWVRAAGAEAVGVEVGDGAAVRDVDTRQDYDEVTRAMSHQDEDGTRP